MSSDAAPTLGEIKSFVNEHFRASDSLFQPRYADPVLGDASLETPQLLSEQEQHEVLSNLLLAHASHIRLLPTGRVLVTLTGTELLVQLVSCREHFAALKFRRAYWRAKNAADAAADPVAAAAAAAALAKSKEEARQAAKELERSKRAAASSEAGEDAPVKAKKAKKAPKAEDDDKEEDIAAIAKKSKIVRTLEAEKAAEEERKARREARLAAAEAKKDLMAEDDGSSGSDSDDAPAPVSARDRAAPDVNADDMSYLASLKRASGNTLESVNEKRREKREAKRKSKRFILFVGNLPYNYDESRIRELFYGTEIIGVRVPTHRETQQPQGYAFVEFESSRDVHYALSKHHEYVGERRINVELTAGGGGNSKARRSKISAKAQQLALERVENAERAAQAESTTGPSWHGGQ